MTARDKELLLARKLVQMIELMLYRPTMTLSDEARRSLPGEVACMRQALFGDDAPRLVGAEAACAVELMIALDDARAAGDAARADRMKMFLNSFEPFLQTDLRKATLK